jgi:hypothetical protein
MRLYQPGREPVPTLVVSDDPYQSYVRTLYLSTLERTAGAVARGLYIRETLDAPQRLEHTVAAMDGPVRIVALSDAAADRARRLGQRYPDRKIEVIRVAG